MIAARLQGGPGRGVTETRACGSSAMWLSVSWARVVTEAEKAEHRAECRRNWERWRDAQAKRKAEEAEGGR